MKSGSLDATKKKKPAGKKVPGVKAPIPFRDRADLYNGGKMRRVPKQKEGSSVLQTYLNVLPEQKSLADDMTKGSEGGGGGGKKSSGNNSNWLSNLNVYIDPTSASSFLHQQSSSSSSSSSSSGGEGGSKKKCNNKKGCEKEIKWTARDDPGLWREFLIVLFMISITIVFCFGAMSFVLRTDPTPAAPLVSPPILLDNRPPPPPLSAPQTAPNNSQ